MSVRLEWARLEQAVVVGGRQLKVVQVLPRREEQGMEGQRQQVVVERLAEDTARLLAVQPADITNHDSRSGNHHACVTHHRAEIATGVRGGGIAYQFRASPSQVFDRCQHGHGRSVAAHGNVFFPNNLI